MTIQIAPDGAGNGAPSNHNVQANIGDSSPFHYNCSTVTGFFLQDEVDTDADVFDMMSHNFGLIDQKYDTDASLSTRDVVDLNESQWTRFAHKLSVMNHEAPKGTSYKLLYLGRHGQGHHNVGESYYGTQFWDCYFSTLDADPKSPEVVFSDAHLTKVGVFQAQTLSSFWHKQLTLRNTPAPQTFYSSPHTRAIQTANITFGPRPLIIKELLREGHGIHTCDRRSSKSYLQSAFDNIIFYDCDEFTENDEIYSPTLREPMDALASRIRLAFDDIFATDDSTYISMTSHSGTIAGTLLALGHRPFRLPTGGAIPVLVKVETVSGERLPRFDIHDKTGWGTKPECIGDPFQAGRPGFANIGEFLKHLEDKVEVS